MPRSSPRAADPAALTPAAALRALERVRAAYGPDTGERKRALLDRLAGARLATAREVLRLHDALCFLRACPDDRALLARVEELLAAFPARADLRRHRAALADSGIAGTETRFRFFWPTARWLAQRWPERLTVDWAAFEHADMLERLLPLLALPAEIPALDEIDYGCRGWVERLKGPAESDAAFLARRFDASVFGEELKEKLYDELDPPLVLAPGPGVPSRTEAFMRAAPRGAFQRGPLDRARPDLPAALAAPDLPVRTLSPETGQAVIDLARAAMVVRERDLDAFSYGDPRDVRLVDCGGGLAFACVGVRPERRLLLESVYAFLTLRNGVPIGYVLNSALFGSAEIAYNVFETWRGAEAGRVYGNALAMVRQIFGADTFTIFPYQLGDGNEEAIESGAWWFYQKLGFRPKHAGARALMEAELARMRRRPRHRSGPATLRRLARENLYYHHGPERADVIGVLELPTVGLHVTRMIRERFGGDRALAALECEREVRRRLGVTGHERWPRDERGAWFRWAPLVATLPGVADWSTEEKAALVEVVRAKGGRRESDFVRRFDAHSRLRAAVRALAEDDIG